MSSVLVVHHAPSPRLRRILESLVTGLAHPELEEIEVESVPALATTDDHVLRADGYVLLTPANFGYMSGALKHFFDRTYYTCEGAVSGRPYALCVHGDNDTAGAVNSVERIATGWGLQAVAPAVQLTGEPGREDLDTAAEAAATVAAHLLG
ncbi:NAD(P)H-dependent oxidoreductase [Dietzia sp. B32]|uniref:NAD(P)H-dependent oxidoreductase n=1 Tax=Dietzia sp. B32 TaxID=2915130 RepID=UPI0021AD5AFE|nr:NAD(P)H-dependent oxidoreductase [Dietzia sp. B32]UVE95603.1 NAD(P)H-dependent oxidoreductase [Dietzia sp. B32]